MAATGTPTPNIGLRIPLGTDPASVDDINYNSNLIDTKLGAVGNDSVQDQIDDLNSNIANRLETRSIVTTSSTDFKDFVAGVITSIGLVDKPLLISIGNNSNNGWMIYHPGSRRFFAVWGTDVYNGIANSDRTGWSYLFKVSGTPVT